MLHIVPLTLREANAQVAAWHRHHKPVQGHKYAIGCIDDAGALHGILIAGRPVARNTGDHRNTLEVSRVATDGTPNACSILYGAIARAAKALGYTRIQTFTLPEESGSSLRAAGWVCDGERYSLPWVHTDGRERRQDQPTGTKIRWSVTFATRPDYAPEDTP